MKSEIKALLFDIGGVILFYDHMIAAKKMSKIFDIAPKKIFNILNNSKNKFTNSYELGNSPKVYFGILKEELCIDKNKKINLKRLEEIWKKIFYPNKELINFIKKIKKDYKVGLVSNIGDLHEKYISKKYNLNEISSVRVFSYKEKSRKPNPLIYKIALKKLKTKPNEVVFIDDRKENVSAAKKFGMKGIHFKNNDQLFNELRKKGVK